MIYKLQSHVESFLFNDETDILIGLADGKLITWHYPAVPFVDRDILPYTITTVDASDHGRNAHIAAFTGNRISIRKVDGSLMFSTTSSDFILLYELSRAGRWNECIRLCRHQNSQVLWGTLSTMALAKKNIDTVETCLAEINEIPKLEYIQYIKAIPSEEGKQAEMALFKRQSDDAERILLQATPPLIYRAIKMNIRLFRWGRALEIAVKNRSHVDTVLGYRRKYLERFEMEERDPKFLQYQDQMNIDWDAIEAKEAKEIEDERLRGAGGRNRAK